jgi:hypothetical protein
MQSGIFHLCKTDLLQPVAPEITLDVWIWRRWEGRGGATGEGADHDGDKSKLVINLHKLMSVY